MAENTQVFMKKVLIELLIMPFAVLIFGSVAVLGILYTFGKHLLKWDYRPAVQLFPILRSFNLAWDGFANACGGEMMNDALKIPQSSKIRYGKWFQTISAVSGLLYHFKIKDSWLRLFLDGLQKNHCENAITTEDMFYWKNNLKS